MLHADNDCEFCSFAPRRRSLVLGESHTAKMPAVGIAGASNMKYFISMGEEKYWFRN